MSICLGGQTTDRQFFDFPEGFLWGAATSHFQVEGHPAEIQNRASDWSEWTKLEGKISDQSTADKACEFFQRHASDVEICRHLNLKAFRLSLNWPALCPVAPGSDEKLQFNEETLAFYKALLIALKANGIKTVVTLFHFTLPNWLAQRGGWNNKETVSAFGQFTAGVIESLGEYVDYWVTLNEPLVYAYQGYVVGSWPPGHKSDYLSAFQVVRNMLEAHALAYALVHAAKAEARVSFTMHWRPFTAKRRWSPLDNMVRYYRDYVFNLMFPMAVQTGQLQFPFPLSDNAEIKKLSGPIPGLAGTMDYLALNYYTRELCEFRFNWPIDIFGVASKEPELDFNCMGWEDYPEGLYHALTYDLSAFKYNADGSVRPIIITENGYATAFPADLDEGDWSLADDKRIEYLTSHLLALHRAIEDGANVVGYLYWSLLDNFEWAEGLRARFGLVRVAYPTQERTLRKSAEVYADIAKRNGLHRQLS